MERCVSCGKERSPGSDRCEACKAAAAPPSPAAPSPVPAQGRASQPGIADARQLVGQVINGKYQVLSILGEGGMGIVYKVRHLILQNKSTFALKILHPTLCSQPDFRARFLREVEIAMDLTHENIIQLRDFGLTEQSMLFYTMDFFGGSSLKAILRGGALKPQRAIRILSAVLLALNEAHKAGVVHRDLKPDNILIETDARGQDQVRILDFGIAKIVSEGGDKDEGGLTRGSVIGTPRYMSPEQSSGEDVDGRSDLYSLGCIFFEMLTGRVPFDGATTRSILMAHLTAPPPRVRSLAPRIELTADVESLVERLLAKDREARPASAAEVLRILGGNASLASPPRPAPPRPAAAAVPRRGRRTWIGIAAAIVAGALGLGFWGLSARLRPARAERSQPSRPDDLPRLPIAPGRDAEGAGGPSRGRSRLRCEVCGTIYKRGERLGDMCHGVPLMETE